MAYKRRVADSLLEFKLESKGAVLIQGPKWCGKTTTAEQFAGSILYMDNPKTMWQNLHLAEVDPEVLLEGATPRLIDEWQLAPNIWDTVRYVVDHRDGMGQFILTGSSVPPNPKLIHHSGAGRFSKLTMLPMSLFESGESTGKVSLGVLFDDVDGFKSAPANPLSLSEMAFIMARGGWPKAVGMEGRVALAQAKDYFDVVVSSDISRFDGVERNEEKARAILRSYARNIGGQVPVTTILDDIQSNDKRSKEQTEASLNTVRSYITALKGLFVVNDMEAWNPNLRSKTAIRTSPTRYFTDPSIAMAALGIGPADLLNDLNTMGLLFENLCVRDLRVFAEALDGNLFHYRDKEGLECDAVLHLRNGKYGLIEVKLGGETLIKEGIKNLKSLSNKLDVDKMRSPSFKMILVATGDYAYRDDSGVLIVPLGALGV